VFRETATGAGTGTQQQQQQEQVTEMAARTLDEMQQARRFRLPGLRVRLTRRMSEVDVVMRVPGGGEGWSVSGFPRVLEEE
jgi:hypothetical protein